MITSLPSHVFRVTRDEYALSAKDALSGAGGLYDGGRWHTKGQPIVYTASDSSGCLLERLVHGDEWIAERHRDRVMLTITIPVVSSVHYTARELAAVDPHWQIEGNLTCRRLGDLWIAKGGHCALIVPSAANPHAANILFNPAHSEFSKVLAVNDPLSIEPLSLDDRVVSLANRFRAAAKAPA